MSPLLHYKVSMSSSAWFPYIHLWSTCCYADWMSSFTSVFFFQKRCWQCSCSSEAKIWENPMRTGNMHHHSTLPESYNLDCAGQLVPEYQTGTIWRRPALHKTEWYCIVSDTITKQNGMVLYCWCQGALKWTCDDGKFALSNGMKNENINTYSDW